MVYALRLGVILFLIVAGVCLTVLSEPSSKLLEKEWFDYKIEFNKIYPNKTEDDQRKLIFFKTLAEIKKHNAEYDLSNPNAMHYLMGLNEFSDWTDKEKSRLHGLRPSAFRLQALNLIQSKLIKSNPIHLNSTQFPKELDYRTKGFVTPVKNQKSPPRLHNCGSCWAFSATGALEGQIYKKTKKLISLSEQQLVDCSSNGCGGGYVNQAFNYMRSNGINTEESYPYENQGYCRHDPKNNVAVKVLGHEYISGKDYFIHALVNVGPISVYFKGSNRFDNYKSGIFHSDPECKGDPSQVNHAMLIVGFGVENGKKYWLVKNSYGLTFGESGYIKVIRGVNFCSIETFGYYPVVE